MSDRDNQSDVKSNLQYFLNGAGLPGAIFLFCAMVCGVLALFQGQDFAGIYRYVRTGALIGFGLSVLGLGEILVGYLSSSSGSLIQKVWFTAGYVLFWLTFFIIDDVFGIEF
ncbi:MAG: hypothetical protein CMK07_05770 [Ponticaulis sp.]|nr:hypothetical protein [Ponticaulis sp.]